MKGIGRTVHTQPEERTKKVIIGREHIGFFKAILESYEDVAIFSVLDGRAGLIEIIYPDSFENDVLAIIREMERDGIAIREVVHDGQG